MRSFWQCSDLMRRLNKQLINRNVFWIAGEGPECAQNKQWRDDCSSPIGNLGKVKREPPWKQHDLDRHGRNGAPVHDTKECKQRTGENIAAVSSAARADRFTRPDHVLVFDPVS